MSCFCKKCRVERKKAKALAAEMAQIIDLPAFILENYRRARERKQDVE